MVLTVALSRPLLRQILYFCCLNYFFFPARRRVFYIYMYTLYGIPNCGSVKKARDFFAAHHIPYSFHDYKKEGISKATLTSWCRQVGWEQLINRNGTTWRDLPAGEQQAVTTQARAIALMMEHTSVIKRPVITKDDTIAAIRFDEDAYIKTFL